METTMYDMLLRLPLFQGMSRSELLEILGRAIFHFHKVADGKVLYRQGEECKHLTYLMSGTLVGETRIEEAHLTFSEISYPCTPIETYSLFGKRPCYKATYRAQGEVSLFSIDKQCIYALTGTYEVFRINLLNLLGSRAESLYERLWTIHQQGLEGRMVCFIHNLCSNLKGPKVLNVKMDDLACLMDDTRLNISRTLNRWQDEGLIELRRKEFVIHDMTELLKKVGK